MHLSYFLSLSYYFLFPLLSSSPHLYYVFQIHSGCLTTTSFTSTQTATNAILLTCGLSAPRLLYPSLSLWASGTVSLWSTKQILFPLLLPKLLLTFWALTRDLDSSKRLQQPLLHSLTTSPSLHHPPVRLGRVEVLVFSFQKIGNTQLILPYAIITHWNLMLGLGILFPFILTSYLSSVLLSSITQPFLRSWIEHYKLTL